MSEYLGSVYKDSESHHEIPGFKITDLFNLTVQEKENLGQRIRNSQGSLNILVHPYFHQDNRSSWLTASPSYIKARDEFIRESLSTDGIPLVIFEQATDIPLLASRIGLNKGDCYLVPTHPEIPTPLIEKDEDSSWNELDITLKGLDVKHATVGGRYMYFAAFENSEGLMDMDVLESYYELKQIAEGKPRALSWLNKKILPFGCAGLTAKQLVRLGFDVSLSSISSPTSYYNEEA